MSNISLMVGEHGRERQRHRSTVLLLGRGGISLDSLVLQSLALLHPSDLCFLKMETAKGQLSDTFSHHLK